MPRSKEMEAYNPFSLAGKHILVTGASSGIGRGIAVECARMGATVVATGRNEARLKETLSQFPGEGHSALPADLTNTADVQRLVDALPRLDGVVHSAGIGDRVLCKNLTEADLDRMMDTNYKAPVMLQTALIQKKKLSREASIVFIASVAAESPSFGNAMYCASKAAIISYAKCLALELAPRLIRVNCIQPAMVWTDLVLRGGLTREDLHEDEMRYPLRRYGQPEDVAHLAVYMLSNAAAWMTGSAVKLTGGEAT